MIYRTFIPSMALRNMVKCIWVLEDENTAPSREYEKILPDGSPEMIFHYGDRFHTKANGIDACQQRSFLFGQLTSYIELKPAGKIGVIGIKFHPHGAYQLTGIPQWQLNDAAVGLENIFGKKFAETEEKINLSTSIEERIQHVEHFLLRLAGAASLKKKKDYSQITYALQTLASPFQKNDKAALAASLYISKRELERRFSTMVGLSPVQYAKIIRFQYVFQVKEKMKSLTELALTAGYYDQSHFIKDFKAIAGVNPGSFFKQEAKLTETFIARE